MTVRTVKIKTLGLSRTYRIEFYEGDRLTKAARFSRKVHHYDKAIFPLYKSYAGQSGKELAMDKRQNVLRNPWIWILALALGVLFVVCLSYLRLFFKKSARPSKTSARMSQGLKAQGIKEPLINPPRQSALPPLSSSRIVGEVTLQGFRWMVIMDEQGRSRLENPANFFGRGVMLSGQLAGQRLTTWGGQAVVQPSAGAAP